MRREGRKSVSSSEWDAGGSVTKYQEMHYATPYVYLSCLLVPSHELVLKMFQPKNDSLFCTFRHDVRRY